MYAVSSSASTSLRRGRDGPETLRKQITAFERDFLGVISGGFHDAKGEIIECVTRKLRSTKEIDTKVQFLYKFVSLD